MEYRLEPSRVIDVLFLGFLAFAFIVEVLR
jgi:hypothetical protein